MPDISLLYYMATGAAIGLFCGGIPCKSALARNQTTFAIVSLVVCILLGMFSGCLLALPAALILRVIVVGMGEKEIPLHSSGVAMSDYEEIRRSLKRDGYVADPLAAKVPYTVVGPVIICNDCRKACSKIDGKIPAECPSCQANFDNVPVVPKARKKAQPVRESDDPDVVDLKPG